MTDYDLNLLQTCASALLTIINHEIISKEQERNGNQSEEFPTPLSMDTIHEEFTMKEISSLPKKIQELMKRKRSHYRLKANGVHEFRVKINGKNISASSKDYSVARTLFLKKLSEYNNTVISTGSDVCAFIDVWFNLKKPTLKERSFKQMLCVYKNHILPEFKGKTFEDITPMVMQSFFNSLMKDGKRTKTSVECQKILNQVFNSALGEGLLKANPIERVTFVPYESKKGLPLTLDEESDLLKNIEMHKFKLCYIVYLYTGIRRGEINSLTISEDKKTISVISEKTRCGLNEKKRVIPVTPMLEPYMNDIMNFDFKTINLARVSSEFSKICEGHHLHELRHTFISRCRENCGISREVVMLLVGHTPKDVTTNTYTSYSIEYLITIGARIKYLIPS